MRLQIVSDLHLETRPKQTFQTMLEPGLAPALALLGDIAPLDHPNLRPFLEWCSERWATILYIPGMLECFGGASSLAAAQATADTYEVALFRLRTICSPYQNIHVLVREGFYSADGLLILGCPFWGLRPTEPQLVQTLHRGDLAWIRSMTRRYSNPCLVLSHIGPVPWAQEEDMVRDPDETSIFPEMEMLLRKPIVAWAFGHVHDTIEFTKTWSTANGIPKPILLVANGLGPRARFREYLPEELGFRRDAIVRIDAEQYIKETAES